MYSRMQLDLLCNFLQKTNKTAIVDPFYSDSGVVIV